MVSDELNPQEEVAVCKKFKPVTSSQKVAWEALSQGQQIVMLTGSAGTGKTECAAAYASKLWSGGKIDNIYIIRPYKHLGDDYGATKGNDAEKLLPFAMSVLGKLVKYLGVSVIRDNFILDGFEDFFSEKKGIKIVPVEKCQGMSFSPRDFIIVDEVQNCSKAQVKALVTRPEAKCQMALCGDETQSALGENNGLKYLMEFWQKNSEKLSPFQTVVEFSSKENLRKGISKVYTELFEEEGQWIS